MDCDQYPRVCRALIALYNLGAELFTIQIILLSVFLVWKEMRLIAAYLRHGVPLRAMNRCICLDRLYKEIEKSLANKTNRRLNVGVGLNVNENIAFGIEANQTPVIIAAVMEIPTEIDDEKLLDTDIALGTDTNNKAPNQVNAEVKLNCP